MKRPLTSHRPAPSVLRLPKMLAGMVLLLLGAFLPLTAQNGLQATLPTAHASEDLPLLAFDHVPGHIIFKIKPAHRAQCGTQSIGIADLQALFQAHGGSYGKIFPQAPEVGQQTNAYGQAYSDISLIYEWTGDPATPLGPLLAQLAAHPAVAYAEPRYIHEVFIEPNDTYFQDQWYLDSLHASAAWDSTLGDTNVVIGIVDTGTSFAHPDLTNVAINAAEPIDGIDNDGDGYIDNRMGWDFGGSNYFGPGDNDPNYVGNYPGMDHGVLVTGPACANWNNGTGISGISANCRYLPIKTNIDNTLGISYGYDGLVYAAEHGAGIINLSWGSGASSQFGQDVVNYAAINQGCLVVAASGNSFATDNYYPASYENVLSVAAMQNDDKAWNNLNGRGTTHNFEVDLAAPGRSILTSAGAQSYWFGATGTSMAAPMVCAAAALAKSKFPWLSYRQAGEMVRVSCRTDMYLDNPGLEDKLGYGSLQLGRTLSGQYSQAVRVDSLLLDDGEDMVLEGFDSVHVGLACINFLDGLQNLEVELSSPDTQLIEIVNGTYQHGQVSSNTPFMVANGLRFYIRKEVNEVTTAKLKITFRDADFEDWHYLKITIFPNRVDLQANNLHTTINGRGNIGFTDYPFNDQGLGLVYGQYPNILRDAGLLIGISQTKVVDAMIDQSGGRSNDFRLTSKPASHTPGAFATQEATAVFDDAQAGAAQLGLTVKQRAFQMSDGANDDYIIMEYTIRNENNYALNDVYAGLGADWRPNQMTVALADYLPASHMTMAKMASNFTSMYLGISLLTDQAIGSSIESRFGFGFSDAEKYLALSRPAGTQGPRSGSVVQFISAGPFDLAAGDSAVIAFALVGATTQAGLVDHAMLARTMYNCEISNRKPAVDLGGDYVSCANAPLPWISAAGANLSYLWSTGDTAAAISPSLSGSYSVEVTNQFGCRSSDTVAVNIHELTGYQVLASLPAAEVNEQVFLEIPDPQQHLQSWLWDFGDGQSSSLPNALHFWSQAGNYMVQVAISDSLCTDTLYHPISVSPATGLLSGTSSGSLEAYPNPVQNLLHLRINAQVDETAQLTVFDLSGKSLMSRPWELRAGRPETTMLDLTSLPAGVYLLELRSVHGNQQFRIQRD